LGSKSGFDSIKECFGDLTDRIHAIETGLSSDPTMNGRLSQLDRFALVSNSDAHSASKLGREANIFDTELSYDAMYRALADKKDKGFLGTIEFFPEEGKYHADGCAKCKLRLTPQETKKYQGRCPTCNGLITVGVMARVEELADRAKSSYARPYKSLIPLEEVIAEARSVGKASKKVQALYFDMINKLGPELGILMDVPVKDIEIVAGDMVAEGIKRMRDGQVHIAAGYDGLYGVIKIFDNKE
jgi:uncharacterized protein (TIGR00375 family)